MSLARVSDESTTAPSPVVSYFLLRLTGAAVMLCVQEPLHSSGSLQSRVEQYGALSLLG